jgi:NADP-dependent 3-hydroxy acid dehydrogenase YdfG
VQVVAGDVTNYSLAEQAVKVAVEKYNHLDGVILNHGVLGQVAKVEHADMEQWAHGFNVNFLSIVAFVSGIRELLPCFTLSLLLAFFM